jgi:ATP-dependent DNA helicase HFM1/MER3
MQAHKISLLLQSELGGCNFPHNDQFQRHRPTFQQDKNFVFSHVNRLIRCVIDCQIEWKDAISVRNALELERSIASHGWDDSPMQMKQIEQIGVVAVRKLVAAGINCIHSLEETEPNRIEMILSKNPPFGVKVLARLSDFPKLRVTIRLKNKV